MTRPLHLPLIAALAIAVPAMAGAATSKGAGQLDRSFDHDGKTITRITTRYEAATAIGVDTRGRTVATGYSPEEGALVARYHADGSLDRTFGRGGTREARFFERTEDAVAAIDSRDGIVAVANNALGKGVAVIRFNRHGRDDRTFANGELDDSQIDGAGAITIDSEGRIVIAGETFNGPGLDSDLAIVRLLPTGQPDPSFGTDGEVITSVGGEASAGGVDTDANGRVVVAGDVETAAGRQALIARYGDSGTLDRSFNADGLLRADVDGGRARISGLALSRGKILIAGEKIVSDGHSEALLARANGNGTLDHSFGKNGFVTSGFRGKDASASAIATDSRDRIVLVGGAQIRPGNNGNDHLILRYQRSGKLDHSFSGDGKRTVDAGLEDGATGVAIDGRDRILVAGTARLDGTRTYYQSHFSVMRLLGG